MATAWFQRETKFVCCYIAIYLCLTQSNAFLGKNIGLPSLTPKVKPKPAAKRDDEHPRHDVQTRVPAHVACWSKCACITRLEMSGIKKNTANFSQVEAGHIFVLKYTGRVVSKNIISALPASVWSKNNGGGGAGPPGPSPGSATALSTYNLQNVFQLALTFLTNYCQSNVIAL